MVDSDEVIRRRVAERIRALRRQKHLTQAELARRIGVRPGPMNAIEQARHVPTGRTFLLLAGALDVSVDDLLAPRKPSKRARKEEPAPYLVFKAKGSPDLTPYAEPMLLEDDPAHRPALQRQLNAIAQAFLALEDFCGSHKQAAIPLSIPFTQTESGMETLARQVRTLLGIGEGVIFDYLELLENTGLRIAFCRLPSPSQSATYYDSINANAFIFVHTGINVERQVFELIKRLGAIYVHTRKNRAGDTRGVKGRDTLDDLHAVRKFTAFFLMPEQAVRTSVAQLGIGPEDWTYPLMLRIKHRFGVSAESFVYRLKELDLVTGDLAGQFERRIEDHYQRHRFEEPDRTRRILTPNGRLGDLLAVAEQIPAHRRDAGMLRTVLKKAGVEIS